MIENIVKDMSDLVDQLKSSINQDLLDIKEAKHEEKAETKDSTKTVETHVTEKKDSVAKK